MNAKWVGFLRIVVGIFFISQGLNKLEWYSTSEFLKTSLDRYSLNAHPITLWYQDHVAKPGVEAWARLIPTGELLIGVGLVLGLLVRPTLIITLLLVINFHVANGGLFSRTFFVSPYAMLLLASLVFLIFNNAGGAFALEKRVARKKPTSP